MKSFYQCLFLLWSTANTVVYALTSEELKKLLESVKGDDTRLFRWDASEHTAERQAAGDCAQLSDAAKLLISTDSSIDDKKLAAEYATFCITDNPKNRATFGDVEGIHKAVVDLVGNGDARMSSLASHLVYIATYTNEKNHQTFHQQGAVEALGKVILNTEAIPVQKMWAAAALQNLAASYCETEEDGTCFWDWTEKDEHIQLSEDSPLHSDGTAARRSILEVDGLVHALVDLACEDSIEHDEQEAAMPGYNAVEGEHDRHLEVSTWAAMSALKNLALEPSAKPELEKAMYCACFLKDSPDWLEEAKAYGFLFHMRRHDEPCIVREDKGDLCVDGNFLDEEFFHCSEYAEATKEECEQTDIFTGVKASEACCECGGGHSTAIEVEHDEL